MKGTTNATQQTLFGEILNLRLVTNQSSHEDLIGATVKINSQIYTWNGQDITVEIPAMMTYTIEVSEVEGYRTPEIQTIDSQTGNVNNMTLSYDCELVIINVSDSDGNTLDSSNVTINGVVGNKVPYGQTYTVVANAINGYNTPESQTYTANWPQRAVNMVYQVNSFGVFIEDIDGNLYTEAQWDGSKTANGVAVITENCSFVIALNSYSDVPGSYLDSALWASAQASSLYVEGVTTTSNFNYAPQDYNGKSNTEIIISRQSSTPPWEYPAASYCYKYIFPNGKKGYLGAAGELIEVYMNIEAVEDALNKCGGKSLKDAGYHWTSTQYDVDRAWTVSFYNGYMSPDYKNHQYNKNYVRAFTTLKSDD